MKKILSQLIFFSFVLLGCKHHIPEKVTTASADFYKAEALLNHKNDSAFFYYNKVATQAKDSLWIAIAYNRMAGIQSDAGDYFGAQESLSVSLRYLHERKLRDRACLSSDHNELGMTSFNLKQYRQAISYYQRGIELAADSNERIITLNNQANAYAKLKEFDKALAIYRDIIGKATKDTITYARILTNMTVAQWQAQPNYNAAPPLLRALKIRQKIGDQWGENSSYAHLADYYGHSKPDSSLYYAKKMYEVARILNSPDDQLEAMQKLVLLVPPAVARVYFDRYQILNDSLQTVRNAAKNQFAMIRYQSEKNKADNLRLQKDNEEKRYQIIAQRLLLGLAFIIIAAGVVFSRFWYLRRRQRHELEKQNAVHERELALSQRVHDVVANNLYEVMNQMDRDPAIDKRLTDQLEILYERSRNISHEEHQTMPQDLVERIIMLISSFATDERRTATLGIEEVDWSVIPEEVKLALSYILRELLINMKKHSGATSVAIRFSHNNNTLWVNYTDNGIGMPIDINYGNGLKSTVSRIKSIGGNISFENMPDKGLQICITIPAS